MSCQTSGRCAPDRLSSKRPGSRVDRLRSRKHEASRRSPRLCPPQWGKHHGGRGTGYQSEVSMDAETFLARLDRMTAGDWAAVPGLIRGIGSAVVMPDGQGVLAPPADFPGAAAWEVANLFVSGAIDA